VARFCQWYRSLETFPTICLLRSKLETIRQKELKKACAALSLSSEKDRKILEVLTSAIVNKILHDPITFLKRTDDHSSTEMFVDAVRKLFRLEEAETIGEEDQQTENRNPGK